MTHQEIADKHDYEQDMRTLRNNFGRAKTDEARRVLEPERDRLLLLATQRGY